MTEEFSEIVLKEKEKSFYISRIPKQVKEEIIKLANEYFAEDYGMCIKWCFEQAIEYQNYKETFDIKLNYIIELLEKQNPKVEQAEKKSSIKMLDGREMKGGNKKNESIG
jgi:hypothetical protein